MSRDYPLAKLLTQGPLVVKKKKKDNLKFFTMPGIHIYTKTLLYTKVKLPLATKTNLTFFCRLYM